MEQSHSKIVWIWESMALMEVNLSQIFDSHFIRVIIYFEFEGEKNANYENKELLSNTVFTIYAMQRLF